MMNANELADELREVSKHSEPHTQIVLGIAESFLRQQQAEIEALKAHPVKEQYKFGVDWSKDGNAVTVLKICEDGVAEVVFMDYQEATHPVKELTLNPEKIIELQAEYGIDSDLTCHSVKDFVKAILRKAQE